MDVVGGGFDEGGGGGPFEGVGHELERGVDGEVGGRGRNEEEDSEEEEEEEFGSHWKVGMERSRRKGMGFREKGKIERERE